MPPSTKTYKITPAPPSSIPTLAHISHAAFKTDTHTQLKELCKPSPKPQSGTSSHAASMASALSSWKSSSKGKIVVLQAVQEESGEIVGWAAWAGKGVDLVGKVRMRMRIEKTRMRIGRQRVKSRARESMSKKKPRWQSPHPKSSPSKPSQITP
ncbi:hypothetical protein ONS95_014904 [Cadophora gregata]|uniref:uncharacterized protein n=1 Tax=Cadophora gregata TaxID=51156 RepID=UPI0026DD1ADF|nr:uncharacterized protein ONS95_014904 [Cadophora gregata]KAK0113209.1 hypothetical protein ONS95_014904 [Cadophora gregata]